MEFLFEYGLFLAKAITIVGAFVVIVGVIAGAAMKQKPAKGQLAHIEDGIERAGSNSQANEGQHHYHHPSQAYLLP